MASQPIPSPERTVTSSVAMMRRLGYGKLTALKLIVMVCDHVLARPDMQHCDDRGWACAVRTEAITRICHVRGSMSTGSKARNSTGGIGA